MNNALMPLVVLLAITLLVAGCSAFPALYSEVTDDGRRVYQAATVKVIDGSVERRDAVLEGVERVRSVLDGEESATLKEIRGVVEGYMEDQGVPPEIRFYVREVMREAYERLKDKASQRGIQMKVKEVLLWVEEAAKLTQVSQGRTSYPDSTSVIMAETAFKRLRRV